MGKDKPEKKPREVPSGAAVFPTIPAELGIDPLLLAVLHAIVFLDGSTDAVVHPAAAQEAQSAIAEYLSRLSVPKINRLREDLNCLVEFAKQDHWPAGQIEFLNEFLTNYGPPRG